MKIHHINKLLRPQSFALAAASVLIGLTAACSSTRTTGSVSSNGVTVTCTPAIMAPSTTSQCNAKSVNGASTTFTWSASAGTITSAGLFTAPSSTGNVTITAANPVDSGQTGTQVLTVQLKTPPSQHVVMLMEENQEYSIVYGNTVGWPNLNKLITQGALATNYYADVHPSIGNYFMLTTGQLVTTNDDSTTVWNVDNIARRMLANNVSFKVYAEGIPKGYLGGNEGNYVIRHNPFALLSDVGGNSQVANEVIVPFSQFASDVASNALPQFSFIVPGVNDDAHSGTQGQADTWLQANVVGPLSGLAAFQSGDGVLIVDFDEGAGTDSTNGGGHVAPVFWGPLAASGYQQKSSNLYQHESMLRTVMEVLGLPDPPGNAANAPDMAEFFVQK